MTSCRQFDCFKRRLWLDVALWYRAAATPVGCLISSSIFRQKGPLMSHCRRKSPVTSARPTVCLIASSIFRTKSPSITHFHKKSLVMNGRTNPMPDLIFQFPRKELFDQPFLQKRPFLSGTPIRGFILFSNFCKKSPLINHFHKRSL